MSIKEIGSVFHACTFPENIDYIALPNDAYYYGCGRYAINALIKHHLKNKLWRRLFVPEYFCYEVIDSIRSTGIEVVFYPDSPFANDQNLVKEIKFRERDVLFRMNYFGNRTYRDNSDLNVTVIEDHSHNLFSDWALNSNADWCIASLRKTLPIPDGGILWSPKGFIPFIDKPLITTEHSELSIDRYQAMEMKKMYLESEVPILKNDYLKILERTEAIIGSAEISALSDVSKKIIQNTPAFINQKKKDNYISLVKFLKPAKCVILKNTGMNTAFSLVLLFDSNKDRDWIRQRLSNNNVYSNILWNIHNDKAKQEVIDFSKRMLSLPIDFRYSEPDIFLLSQVLNSEMMKL